MAVGEAPLTSLLRGVPTWARDGITNYRPSAIRRLVASGISDLAVFGVPEGSWYKCQAPLRIGLRKKTYKPITIYCTCWSCGQKTANASMLRR
jgi:hypothetical protein